MQAGCYECYIRKQKSKKIRVAFAHWRTKFVRTGSEKQKFKNHTRRSKEKW